MHDLGRRRIFTSQDVTFYANIFPFGASPQNVMDQAKGENLQRSIDGLMSNNLGHEVHSFADLDNRVVSDSSINLQRQKVPNGEAHQSLKNEPNSFTWA